MIKKYYDNSIHIVYTTMVLPLNQLMNYMLMKVVINNFTIL